MHIFTPGAVARAEEVNDNFKELVDTKDSDNEIVINGRRYPASGSWDSIPSFSYAVQYTGVNAGTLDMPLPYTPPTGYRFAVHVFNTSGFFFVDGAYQDSQKVTVRVLQIGGAKPKALNKIGWTLVKE